MIIFIGGPPRVGKTVLARSLAKQFNISWLSTDDLRHVIMETEELDKNHPLNILKTLAWHNRKTFYDKYSPREVIQFQNTESRALSVTIKAFVDALDFHKRDFILEGVALLPRFYSKAFIKKHDLRFFCIGNHTFSTFAKHSWKKKSVGDWLKKIDKGTFNKIIKYCVSFSGEFKEDCAKYSLPYYRIHSRNFKKDIEKLASSIAIEVQQETGTMVKAK